MEKRKKEWRGAVRILALFKPDPFGAFLPGEPLLCVLFSHAKLYILLHIEVRGVGLTTKL